MSTRETDTLPLEETDTLPMPDEDPRPYGDDFPAADAVEATARCLTGMKLVGKALGQIALYRIEHPAVTAAIEDALEALRGALAAAPQRELRLSVEDRSLTANGRLVGTPLQIQSSVLNLFRRFGLGRLTLRAGLEYFELEALCELAASRPGSANASAAEAFLADRGVTHVVLNDFSGRAPGRGASGSFSATAH